MTNPGTPGFDAVHQMDLRVTFHNPNGLRLCGVTETWLVLKKGDTRASDKQAGCFGFSFMGVLGCLD